MIEKEYYRIEELEKRFDISFSDLQYLVENEQIDVAFLLSEPRRFIIGGWRKDQGFIGYSKVIYQGLVKVHQIEQLNVLSKKARIALFSN